jgi:hypothetical protein
MAGETRANMIGLCPVFGGPGFRLTGASICVSELVIFWFPSGLAASLARAFDYTETGDFCQIRITTLDRFVYTKTDTAAFRFQRVGLSDKTRRFTSVVRFDMFHVALASRIGGIAV